MPADDSFAEVMARLRGGDNEAAARVFQQFAGRLIGLARARMDGKLKQKIDPEDVAQSALKSFFVRNADGQFDLANWDSLWALLVVLALRKCNHQAVRYKAARRDVRREQAPPAADDSRKDWQAFAEEPNPSHAAMLTETVEQLMRSMENEREREMLVLSLQGYTAAEISARVGRSERTVYRVLTNVRERLDGMHGEASIVE
jgi:RNA polymerase sigma-70 factor (ECF subfamily)